MSIAFWIIKATDTQPQYLILLIAFQPAINLTHHPYLRIMWIRTLGHVRDGNMCGGDNLLSVL